MRIRLHLPRLGALVAVVTALAAGPGGGAAEAQNRDYREFGRGHQLNPMTFRLARDVSAPNCTGQGAQCAMWIVAEGDIMPNSAEAYEALVRRSGRRLPVMIHSPGGSLMGGMRLGIAFRRTGTTVIVGRALARGTPAAAAGNRREAPRAAVSRYEPRPSAGVCASACVHAFAGGVARSVPDGAVLGVHESFRALVRNGQVISASPADAADDESRLQVLRLEAAYFQAMGVDPSIVRYAIGVPPQQLRQLSASERVAVRLETGGTVVASAATPALRSFPQVQRGGGFDDSSR